MLTTIAVDTEFDSRIAVAQPELTARKLQRVNTASLPSEKLVFQGEHAVKSTFGQFIWPYPMNYTRVCRIY